MSAVLFVSMGFLFGMMLRQLRALHDDIIWLEERIKYLEQTRRTP